MSNLLEYAQAIILLATQEPNKYKEIACNETFVLPDEAHNLLSKRINAYQMQVWDNHPSITISFSIWPILEQNIELQARYTLEISKLAPIFTDNFYMMLDTPIKDEFHLFSLWFDHCISPTNEIEHFRKSLIAVLEKTGLIYEHYDNLHHTHYSFSRFLLPSRSNYHDTFCMADLLFKDYFELYGQG